MDKGVKFTINSDNMSVSNTTVKKEFIALNNVFGATPEVPTLCSTETLGITILTQDFSGGQNLVFRLAFLGN